MPSGHSRCWQRVADASEAKSIVSDDDGAIELSVMVAARARTSMGKDETEASCEQQTAAAGADGGLATPTVHDDDIDASESR